MATVRYNNDVLATFQGINRMLDSYTESYRALLCLENNLQFDSVAASIRLHAAHVKLYRALKKALYKVGHKMQKSDVLKIISLGVKAEGRFLLYDIKNCYFGVGQKAQLAFDFKVRDEEYEDEKDSTRLYLDRWEFVKRGDREIHYCVLEYTVRYVLYFRWDEDSYSGFRGEEPTIEEYRRPDLEEYILSLGLTPRYESDYTYHSRRITLYGE